ncbi:MAG: GspE/PulE family protein [Polyangiaceae bacterium]|jgi:general secretion pathway protein E/type IV pilus assembly protein PilB|nr:GspE/PulE family protein [Polyangiaceae bacterium]
MSDATHGRDKTFLRFNEGDAVAILDDLVRRAVALGASDIHIEPKRDRVMVRYRVDGTLTEQPSIHLDVAPQVVSRIKVLSRMDISERRLPQDGQFTLEAGLPFLVNLRAATFPCTQGEKVVLRLLLGQSLIPFDQLGMDPDTRQRVKTLVRHPQGFIVTCGPTGSGKTSSLYAFLQLLDTARVNVVTLENPIEVELYSITQGQTNARAGFTFAAGLRAALRQDPDVILVGEIRDAETAGIALQAALTGHQVMSTLHTSDVVETVVRLVDLGVEPWIIGNALSAVLAQRLVRLACPECRDVAKIESDFWDGDELLLEEGSEVVRPRGCAACQHTGYKGRTGVFQALEMDDDIRSLVKAKAAPAEYRELLAKRRVPSLRRVGFEKVQAGLTTVDEVMRVTSG